MPSKDKALDLISDPSQRHLLEALADMQALPDDHPTWAMIAMVAVVMNGSRRELDATATDLARLASEVAELRNQVGNSAKLSDELREELATVKLVLADAAHLNRRMPSFLDKVEEVFGDTRAAIRSINARLAKLEGK